MHLPHRQPRVPHSSVRVLTANYPNSCVLSTLMLSHKRDLQRQWGAAWLASLNSFLTKQSWKCFLLSSNKGSWPYRLVIHRFKPLTLIWHYREHRRLSGGFCSSILSLAPRKKIPHTTYTSQSCWKGDFYFLLPMLQKTLFSPVQFLSFKEQKE